MNTKIKYWLLKFSLILILGTASISPVLASETSTTSSNTLAETNLHSLSEEADNTLPEEETPVTDLQLYQADVPVSSSSDTERNQAFTQLLEKVLVKISANPKITALPAIKAALKKPDSFIEQFSYTHGNPLQLNAHFNAEKINTLLTDAGQTLFNQQRPPIVIWLILHENNENTHLMGVLSDNTLGQDWLKSLREYANAVGLTIVFPFGDLEDLSALSTENLEKITPKKLEDASRRYETQQILVIKMNTDQTDPCSAEWLLRSDEQPTLHWNENFPTCQAMLQAGITHTLHHLLLPNPKKSADFSPLLAEKSEAIQMIHLSITHIQSAEEYQHALNILQNISDVTHVDIEKVTPTSVFYILHVTGNLASIAQSLSEHSELQLLKKNEDTHDMEYMFIEQDTPQTERWKEQKSL